MTNDNDFRTDDSMTSDSIEQMDEGQPLPIFQNLPELEFGADELAGMKRSVHELIHARAVEAAIEEGHDAAEADHEDTAPNPAPNSAPRRWARRIPRQFRQLRFAQNTVSSAGLRVAAAFGAVALATSLLVPSFAPQPLQVAQSPVDSASTRIELAAALAEAEALPLVENLNSEADLIQIEDDGMSVVVAAIQ